LRANLFDNLNRPIKATDTPEKGESANLFDNLYKATDTLV
jgi:hypothetical protein